MKFLDFLDLWNLDFEFVGSKPNKINEVEEKKIRLSLVVREYLLLMGTETNFYEYWDEHGNENPPVYAFDINDISTIRKLNNSNYDSNKEINIKVSSSDDRIVIQYILSGLGIAIHTSNSLQVK